MHERATHPAARLLNKAKTAARMPRESLYLALSVWLLLWPARAAAMLVPQKHLAKVLGQDRGLECTVPRVDPSGEGRATRLADALALATRYTPFRGPCYAQALVAHGLLTLSQTDHTVFFGVRRDHKEGRGIEAHAWVMAGDIAVSGGCGNAKYTVVRCYVTARAL